MHKDYKNILLINFGGIGDEILFLPVIKSLKTKFKGAKITLALEPRSASVSQLCAQINDVIKTDIKAKGLKKYFNIFKFLLEVRKRKFDVVFSSGKSPLVAVLLFLTGIKERYGYDSKTSFLLSAPVPLYENQYASNMYHDLIVPVCELPCKNPHIETDFNYVLPQGLSAGEFIAIHPGVSKMSIAKGIFKCPNLDFWKNLIAALLEKGEKVLLLGTKDDEELISQIILDESISKHKNFINYFNKTKSLMDMANLTAKSKYLICVDSAPMHVGIAVGAKTFAIFGPTNEKKLIPDDEKFCIITNKNCTCRPCLWHKRAQNCENSECLKIDYKEIISKIYT